MEQFLIQILTFFITSTCSLVVDLKTLLLFIQDIFINLPKIIVWAPTEALYSVIGFLPSTHPEDTISSRLSIIASEHPIFAASVGSAAPYLSGAIASALTIIAVKRYFLKI